MRPSRMSTKMSERLALSNVSAGVPVPTFLSADLCRSASARAVSRTKPLLSRVFHDDHDLLSPSMGSNRKSTRLWIQHTFDSNCKIAGDLEELEPGASTRGRRLALVCTSANFASSCIWLIDFVRFCMELWGMVSRYSKKNIL